MVVSLCSCSQFPLILAIRSIITIKQRIKRRIDLLGEEVTQWSQEENKQERQPKNEQSGSARCTDCNNRKEKEKKLKKQEKKTTKKKDEDEKKRKEKVDQLQKYEDESLWYMCVLWLAA